MTVVLIAPPMAKACEPLLGIATLKGFLEGRGVPCACIDANAEAQEWLLQADRIDAGVADLTGHTGADEDALRRTRSWRTLRRQVDDLKDQLRTPRGYADQNKYRTAVTSLNRTMRIAGSCHDIDQGSPVFVTLTNYEDARYCDMDSSSVAAASRHPEHNLFYEYYRRDLLPRLRALKPTVVGLSFIFRSQLFCGVALAGLIRREMPEVHVVLGGELISAWVDIYEQTHLPEIGDSILPYEGELGLLGLARALEAETPDLSRVPNLIWRDAQGTIHKNATQKLHSLGELPPPDYDWAPWDLYFAPVRTAPMVTARGCYWNRCTFCPEVVNPETLLRMARIDRLTADMTALHERYGTSHFHFIDSALPPRTLKGVARFIIDSGSPFTWYGFSRLEKTLAVPGTAELLGRGGCRMLKLGLETGSQRLLDAMDKRQELDAVSKLLNALHGAGVMVHAFLMFGTPFETEDDAELTRRFVAKHSHAIQFMNCSLMNLAHGSPMGIEPSKHGIKEVIPYHIEGRTLDLALYSNFVGTGWGRVDARRFLHKSFLKDPAIKPLKLRTPVLFDSNHSAFMHPLVFPKAHRAAV